MTLLPRLGLRMALSTLCLWAPSTFVQAQSVADYDAPSVVAGAMKVDGRSFASGRMKLLVKAGQAWEVQAGGKPTGLYFEGEATLAYTAQEPTEIPAVKTNLKRMGLPKVVGDGRQHYLNLPVAKGLLWLPGASLPDWGPRVGTDLPKSFPGHRERFSRVQGLELAHLFALKGLNASKGAVVAFEWMGSEGPFTYLQDGLVASVESLHAFKSGLEPEKEAMHPALISEQPMGWNLKRPLSAPVMLTKLGLEVDEVEEGYAKVTAEETLVPLEAGMRAFQLDLYNVRWGNAGNGSDKAFPYTLKRVRDEQGHELAFHHRRGKVLVILPQAMVMNQPQRIRFEMEGPILFAPQNDQYWYLGVEPWFPQPALSGLYFQLEATLRGRPGYVPIASGTTVERKEVGGRVELKVSLQQPISFFYCAAGKFKLTDVKRGEQLVRVATYTGESIKPEGYAQLAFAVMDHYRPYLGPFPFPEFNIMVVNGQMGWSHGQAPAGFMLLTLGAFKDPDRIQLASISRGINGLAAHEIAHQYWGNVVKWPSPEETWLSEGFAEYVSGLYLRAAKGESEFRGMVRDWEVRARESGGEAPVAHADRLLLPGNYDGFMARTNLLYAKAPYLLSALHKKVGDTTFLTFLKSYQANFRWKFGTTEHVSGLLGFLSKQDLTADFDRWYWGTDMP